MTSVCVYGPGCCAGGTATQALLVIAGEPESQSTDTSINLKVYKTNI